MLDLRSLKNLHQTCSLIYLSSNAREWKQSFETGREALCRKGYQQRLADLIAIHPPWVPYALLTMYDRRCDGGLCLAHTLINLPRSITRDTLHDVIEAFSDVASKASAEEIRALQERFELCTRPWLKLSLRTWFDQSSWNMTEDDKNLGNQFYFDILTRYEITGEQQLDMEEIQFLYHNRIDLELYQKLQSVTGMHHSAMRILRNCPSRKALKIVLTDTSGILSYQDFLTRLRSA